MSTSCQPPCGPLRGWLRRFSFFWGAGLVLVAAAALADFFVAMVKPSGAVVRGVGQEELSYLTARRRPLPAALKRDLGVAAAGVRLVGIVLAGGCGPRGRGGAGRAVAAGRATHAALVPAVAALT